MLEFIILTEITKFGSLSGLQNIGKKYIISDEHIQNNATKSLKLWGVNTIAKGQT